MEMIVASDKALVKIAQTSTQEQEWAMWNQARWEEVRRLFFREHWRAARIARELELDRKTAWRCVRESAWRG